MTDHRCKIFIISDQPYLKQRKSDTTDSSQDGWYPVKTYECIYCRSRRLWLPDGAKVINNDIFQRQAKEG